MDFIRTLLIIGIVLITIQFFVWLLPFIAMIILILWGVRYFKEKFNYSNKESNDATYSSETYSINTSNVDDLGNKKIVDVEYEEV